jgi:hypothetical protein
MYDEKINLKPKCLNKSNLDSIDDISEEEEMERNCAVCRIKREEYFNKNDEQQKHNSKLDKKL